MLTEQDANTLREKGISPERLEAQLEAFRKGFPYLKLAAAASTERGIYAPGEEARDNFANAWKRYAAEGHTIVKFVPASGAASRMFKNMFAFLNASYEHPETDFEKTFFSNLRRFAFHDDLDAACIRLHGLSADALLDQGQHKKIVEAMLCAEGLNYGQLPKGLLKFHSYPTGVRTPAEEHLVEGALYAKGGDGQVKVHFTVSHEHLPLFRQLIDAKKGGLEEKYDARFDVSYSEQKPETDTVAVNPDNTLFRDKRGQLLFRPGGHGALIENLNDIDADIIFIKNIDNVVHDRFKADTVAAKQLLAGILVDTQKTVFDYLRRLDSGRYQMADLLEMLQFVQKRLCCKNPETKMLEDTEMAIYLRRKLNRPIRVCGMVRNVGEPGGGPFLAYNPDGTVSPQILESSQIDMTDPQKKALFDGGTYFNPADLVCATKDYLGEKFDLRRYVDPATGFISSKSKDGQPLKALELPGLWNGAMSDWSTVFVEVPLSTFNPVKTVNDLLRRQHQDHD